MSNCIKKLGGSIDYISSDDLPSFPQGLGEVNSYLKALNDIMKNGHITKINENSFKRNKLQFIIATLNIYRVIEKFSPSDEVLEGTIDELKNWFRFCRMVHNEYNSIPPDDVSRRFAFRENIFELDGYQEPDDEKETILRAIHEQYPRRKEIRGVSATTLDILDEESDHSGEGSVHQSGRIPSPSDSDSSTRDSITSLTTATLRRLLKNYCYTSSCGIEVNDDLLKLLWRGESTFDQDLDTVERTICFLPTEVSFLYDPSLSKVLDFNIGTSYNTSIRDLTDEEKRHPTIIIHNHPRGDTFSLEDLVSCAKKEALEIRAVTIDKVASGSSYRAKMILNGDLTPIEYGNLINGINLFFEHGGSTQFTRAISDDDLEPGKLKYNESMWFILHSLRIIDLEGSISEYYSSDHSQKRFSPDLEILKAEVTSWKGKADTLNLKEEDLIQIEDYLGRL